MRQRSSTRKKGDTELEREKKNKGDIFLSEEGNMKIL